MNGDLIVELLRNTRAAPELWKGWSADRGFEYLRSRLDLSQAELANRSGCSQAQVSRLEGGDDALLSTWKRLYAAMGLELLLVPVAKGTAAEFLREMKAAEPEGYWKYQHARPRRRMMRARKASAASAP